MTSQSAEVTVVTATERRTVWAENNAFIYVFMSKTSLHVFLHIVKIVHIKVRECGSVPDVNRWLFMKGKESLSKFKCNQAGRLFSSWCRLLKVRDESLCVSYHVKQSLLARGRHCRASAGLKRLSTFTTRCHLLKGFSMNGSHVTPEALRELIRLTVTVALWHPIADSADQLTSSCLSHPRCPSKWVSWRWVTVWWWELPLGWVTSNQTWYSGAGRTYYRG